MSITFTCTSCGKKYSVKDDFAGKRVKCAACGATMVLPTPGTNKSLPPASNAGQKVVAPKELANPQGSIFDELELEGAGAGQDKGVPVMAGHILQPQLDPNEIDDFELEPPVKAKVDVGVFLDDAASGGSPADSKSSAGKKGGAKGSVKSSPAHDDGGFDLTVDEHDDPPPPPEPTVPCPGCGEQMKQSAVLCINCGLNVKTGERIEGAKKGGFGKLFGGRKREK